MFFVQFFYWSSRVRLVNNNLPLAPCWLRTRKHSKASEHDQRTLKGNAASIWVQPKLIWTTVKRGQRFEESRFIFIYLALTFRFYEIRTEKVYRFSIILKKNISIPKHFESRDFQWKPSRADFANLWVHWVCCSIAVSLIIVLWLCQSFTELLYSSTTMCIFFVLHRQFSALNGFCETSKTRQHRTWPFYGHLFAFPGFRLKALWQCGAH